MRSASPSDRLVAAPTKIRPDRGALRRAGEGADVDDGRDCRGKWAMALRLRMARCIAHYRQRIEYETRSASGASLRVHATALALRVARAARRHAHRSAFRPLEDDDSGLANSIDAPSLVSQAGRAETACPVIVVSSAALASGMLSPSSISIERDGERRSRIRGAHDDAESSPERWARGRGLDARGRDSKACARSSCRSSAGVSGRCVAVLQGRSEGLCSVEHV